MRLSDAASKRGVYLLYALASAGVCYGGHLVYSGQMPDEKYFKGKNFVPAPILFPLPVLPPPPPPSPESATTLEKVSAESTENKIVQNQKDILDKQDNNKK